MRHRRNLKWNGISNRGVAPTEPGAISAPNVDSPTFRRGNFHGMTKALRQGSCKRRRVTVVHLQVGPLERSSNRWRIDAYGVYGRTFLSPRLVVACVWLILEKWAKVSFAQLFLAFHRPRQSIFVASRGNSALPRCFDCDQRAVHVFHLAGRQGELRRPERSGTVLEKGKSPGARCRSAAKRLAVECSLSKQANVRRYANRNGGGGAPKRKAKFKRGAGTPSLSMTVRRECRNWSDGGLLRRAGATPTKGLLVNALPKLTPELHSDRLRLSSSSMTC
uniref:Uncharacterized protein n=1 Tax=Trichuris muris TaxID=70415 RepID=A0A5S6QZH2_TRIMR